MENSKLESYTINGVFMDGYDIKFYKLFEELMKNKVVFQSLLPQGDAFQYVRWYDFVRDSFYSQLERLSHSNDAAFIGEYVIEFFSAMIDDEKFEI